MRLDPGKDIQIFLDYDGTLVPVQEDSTMTFASQELLETLKELDEKYDMWIVTGRTLESIEGFIGNKFKIVGLHGLVVHAKNGIDAMNPLLEKFRPELLEVLKRNTEIEMKFPGVRIRDKYGSVSYTTWGMSEEDICGLEAFLSGLASQYGMALYPGIRIFEIRIPGVNKGEAIRKLRDGNTALIIGDDLTDEDSFVYNPDAITVKVGQGETQARFRLSGPEEVLMLLKEMAIYSPATS